MKAEIVWSMPFCSLSHIMYLTMRPGPVQVEMVVQKPTALSATMTPLLIVQRSPTADDYRPTCDCNIGDHDMVYDLRPRSSPKETMSKPYDMQAAVKTFFSSPRFAVAGASSDPNKFGHKSKLLHLHRT